MLLVYHTIKHTNQFFGQEEGEKEEGEKEEGEKEEEERKG